MTRLDVSDGTWKTTPGDIAYTANCRPITLRIKVAYAVGHFFNDLCASMWFTYLMPYFLYVKKYSSSTAAELLLVGQLMDGLVTPFIGIASDHESGLWLFRKLGRRNAWHLLGSMSVLLSFPLIFSKCWWCLTLFTPTGEFVYYVILVGVFQFGWAATQVAHLSLIPDLTLDTNERVLLTSARNAFTVAAGALVFALTFTVLGWNTEGSGEPLSPKDADAFQMVVLIVTGVGTLFSTVFHVGCPDPTQSILSFTGSSKKRSKEDEVSKSCYPIDRSLHLGWTEWFLESQFYIVGLVYMAFRLYANLSQVFIVLYLQEALRLPKRSVTVVPLVMFVSGFLASFPIHGLVKVMRVKAVCATGSVIAFVAIGWIALRDERGSFSNFEIYGVVSLIGVASTIVLVTVTALTSDLIGASTSSGAFVFGAMSLLDKFSNGIVVMIIQSLHVDTPEECSLQEKTVCPFYHNVMTYVCGGAALIGAMGLLILTYSQESSKRKDLNRMTVELCAKPETEIPPMFVAHL